MHKLKLLFILLLSIMLKAQSDNNPEIQKQTTIDSLKLVINEIKIDGDADGVADIYDKCPETPSGARIDGSGCPLDIDLDGIIDLYDDCVTEPGERSNKGCPNADFFNISKIFDEPIFFEYQTDKIDSISLAVVGSISTTIYYHGKRNYFILEAHCTEFKSKLENLKMSKLRAERVYQMMIKKYPELKNFNLLIEAKGDRDLPETVCKNYDKCKKSGLDAFNDYNNAVFVRKIYNRNEPDDEIR